MFDGFALERIDVGEVVLRVRHGGAGSPVLLLHGVIQLLAGAPELVSRYRHMETLGKYEHALGENHPDTVSVRTELAHRYRDAGRFVEAIPLFVHVLADHERGARLRSSGDRQNPEQPRRRQVSKRRIVRLSQVLGSLQTVG